MNLGKWYDIIRYNQLCNERSTASPCYAWYLDTTSMRFYRYWVWLVDQELQWIFQSGRSIIWEVTKQIKYCQGYTSSPVQCSAPRLTSLLENQWCLKIGWCRSLWCSWLLSNWVTILVLVLDRDHVECEASLLILVEPIQADLLQRLLWSLNSTSRQLLQVTGRN